MIVGDPVAPMAILPAEPEADARIAVPEGENGLPMSAGTVAAAPIASARRSVGAEKASLIDEPGSDVMAVDPGPSRAILARTCVDPAATP